MRRFQDPKTNEIVTVRFKKRWILYPLFVLELLYNGFIVWAVLSVLPLFAIIGMFLFGGMMERKYLKKGWVEINELGQPIGRQPQPLPQAEAVG